MIIPKSKTWWNVKYHYLGIHGEARSFSLIFGKLYKFCQWDMDGIQNDDGTHFTYKKFQKILSVRGVQL